MEDPLAVNKELVRRLYDEGFNGGDLDVVDEPGYRPRRGVGRRLVLWTFRGGSVPPIHQVSG